MSFEPSLFKYNFTILIETINNSSMQQNKQKLKYYILLSVTAFVGCLLSIYALFVETVARREDSFQALCDVSNEISCSKVFLSEYGKILSKLGIVPHDSMLDVPNAGLGLLFYAIVILFANVSLPSGSEGGGNLQLLLLLLASVLSMTTSAYLAAALYIEMGALICLVCLSTYACNIAIFILTVINVNAANNNA